MHLVTWLNNNTGAVSVILTAAYVLTAMVIVITNMRTVKEMRLTREQQVKPALVVSFETRRRGLMCLVIRNLGGSSAENLKIQLSEAFIACVPRDKDKFKKLKEASLTIVPKQEIIYCCGGPNDFEALSRAVVEGVLSYDDIFGKNHKQDFKIDVESFEGSLLYGPEMDELTSTLNIRLSNIEKRIK